MDGAGAGDASMSRSIEVGSARERGDVIQTEVDAEASEQISLRDARVRKEMGRKLAELEKSARDTHNAPVRYPNPLTPPS